MQVQWVEGESPLRGLEAAVGRLQAAEGVQRVLVGRQAAVAGHVSQELELWLGRENEEGKFDLVARSSNLVQVRTALFCMFTPKNSQNYCRIFGVCYN